MIVLAFLVVVGVALIFIDVFFDRDCACIGAISILFSLLMLVSIPFNRMEVRDFLVQRDARQISYNDLRSNPLEMATVAGQIADYNATLARYQYWSHTQWKLWIPSDVNKTQPIR